MKKLVTNCIMCDQQVEQELDAKAAAYAESDLAVIASSIMCTNCEEAYEGK